MTTRRIALVLSLGLALVAAACGGSEQQEPRPGAPRMLEAVDAATLEACASVTPASLEVTAYDVVGGCAGPSVPDGPAFTTPEGTFALADQFADDAGASGWSALAAAFDAYDASDVATQLSLAYAAYRFERVIGRMTPVGWNDAGDAWEFRMVTVGGEEDGVDVIPPYALRFAIAFDADGLASGVTFLGTCAVPGAEGVDAYPVGAPACP